MNKIVLILSAFVLSIVLSACGTNETKVSNASPKTKTEEETTTIAVKDALGQEIKFDSAPNSIATLSSGDLEILTALDANVTGRPTVSGPVTDEIKEITEIGNPHQPNFEKIAEVHPDVLVASASFKQHAATIEKQGTKVIYSQANSIEDIQTSITMFGKLFAKEDKAEEINKTITDKIESMKTVKTDPVKTLLIYGSPGTYLAALPHSLSGDLLEKAGGENIASDFPQEEKYPQYASLSVEKIIERNPEVVMLITHGDPEAVKGAFEQEMNKNAAWKNLDAVKNGNVVILPSNLFGTNPGTKVTEALEVMKENLEKVK